MPSLHCRCWFGQHLLLVQLRSSLTPSCLRPRFATFAFFMCFLMWFAIPPLMGTLRKPKCEDPMGPICTQCFVAFPDAKGVAMAKDAGCKVCSPYSDGIGMGCGGLVPPRPHNPQNRKPKTSCS
jgi:hypothetical protein